MQLNIKGLQDELASWNARLEALRLHGSLGKMELRDKLAELKDKLDPAYLQAKSTVTELSKRGAEESVHVAKSLMAGWDELRRTHRELSERADRKQE